MSTDNTSSSLPGLEPIYTVQQVATHLQIEPRVIAEMAREMKIIGFKVGREWRFTRTALLAFIKTNTARSAPVVRDGRPARARYPRTR